MMADESVVDYPVEAVEGAKMLNADIKLNLTTNIAEAETMLTDDSLKKSDTSSFKVPDSNSKSKLPHDGHVPTETGFVPDKNKQEKEPGFYAVEKLSPAEKFKLSQSPIPYKEPSWGGISDDKYSLEVLKNGVIIDTIKLEKSYYVFGRLPSCDITMEHPSLSRHHAVIQFCATKTEKQNVGWYLFDLDSTHGTWINKHKVYAEKYYRIHVGHVLKFGGSTRLFVLQGPDEDQEEESEMSVTEMKEQREKQKNELEVLRLANIAAHEEKLEAIRKKEEDGGCLWGMADDAVEDENPNPFSEEIKLENEELYLDDPKKALKGFYEREGYEEPEYIVTDAGSGKYKCAVELPVDGPNGEPVIAEAIVSGKKKEAVLQCALEGCRILDCMNLLRASTHESRKRKEKNWEDADFYDSDEDLYLDRTGDIEKKRQQRMKKAGKTEQKTETYTSLVEKHEVIVKEIQEIEAKLEKAKSVDTESSPLRDAAAMESDDVDALDAYMMAIKSGAMDTKTKMALKRQLLELKQEEMKTRKLVNIAKPASLPELKSPQNLPKPPTPQSQNKLPVIGKVRSHKQKRPLVMSKLVKEIKDEEFVEEEEDDDDDEPLKKYPREDSLSRLEEKMHIDPNSRLQETSSQRSQGRDDSILTSEDTSCEPNDQTSSRLKESAVEENPKTRFKMEMSKTTHKPKKKTVQNNIQTEGKVKGDYDSTDPDYAVWMPPTGQTGDGRTSLNEKLGY